MAWAFPFVYIGRLVDVGTTVEAKQKLIAKVGCPYCGTVGGVFRWRGYGGDARQKFRGGGKAVAAWGRARSLRRNGRKICGGWNGA